MDISTQEQKLRDNYIEVVRIITGGIVINANITTRNDTFVPALMDIFHERLPKHIHMDQYQFNEDYKAKHFLTKFTPAPPVSSTYVQSAWLDA